MGVARVVARVRARKAASHADARGPKGWVSIFEEFAEVLYSGTFRPPPEYLRCGTMLLSKLADDRSNQLHLRCVRAKQNLLDLDLEWINSCLHSSTRGGGARIYSESRERILVTLRMFNLSGAKALRSNASGLILIW